MELHRQPAGQAKFVAVIVAGILRDHRSDLPDGNSRLETALDTLTLALIAATTALLVGLL